MSTVRKEFRYGVSFQADTKGLKVAQQELQKLADMSLKDLKIVDPKATQKDLDQIKSSANDLHQLLKSNFNEKLGTYNLSGLKKSLEALKNPIDANVKSLKQLYTEVSKAGAAGRSAFREMTAEILNTNGNVKETSKLVDSLAKTLGNTIKWSIASSAVNMFTNTISNAWHYTQRLDSSLNDIRIVTEKSNEEMEKFAKNANKAAKNLGASTTSYTNASLIYYQQGLGEQDVQARTRVTLKAANVTGQSASEVSEQLTAVWNGYKVVAQEAELYVDKLAAVAATTAADLEELSTGMSKVASAANAMGVDVDQLSAQLATIVSVTRQDASVVGTALKTIYSRMGDLKISGVDEFGTSLGDVSGQLRQMGIEVLDQEGNLRDMGTVIEEVAGKWNTWTNAQQQAAAVAIAGKRQYNNLIALFENWDMYESARLTSQGSAGTLQKQQEIYLDSLEAKLNRLSVAGEKVFDNLIDSESTKKLIDFISGLIEGLGELVEGFGGLAGILPSVGALLTNLFNAQLGQGLMRLKNNASSLVKGVFGVTIKDAQKIAADEGLKDIGKNETAIEDIRKLREQELKNVRYLTEEERERYELLRKQRIEIANRKDALDEERQELVKTGKKMFGVSPKSKKSFNTAYRDKKSEINSLLYQTSHPSAQNEFDQIGVYTKETRDILNQNETEGLGTGFNAQKLFSMSSEALKKTFTGEGKVYTEEGKLRSETEDYTEFAYAIEGLVKVKQQEERVFKAVDGILDKNSETYIKIKNAQKGFYNGAIEGKQYLNLLYEALKETGISVDQFGNKLDKNTQDVKENGKALADHNKDVEDFGEKTNHTLNKVMDGLSALMALGSVFSIISDGTKQATEGTLNFGDVLSSLIGIAFALVPAFVAVNSAAGMFGVIALAVGAFVAGVAAIASSLPKAKTELEKANEALEAAKEKANEARTAYSELNNELKDLSATIEDLKLKDLDFSQLIPGTTEYTKALDELNTQILNLVESYPALSKFLSFENGKFVLKDETSGRNQDDILNDFQKDQQKYLDFLNKNILITQRDIYKKDNDKIKQENNSLIPYFEIASQGSLAGENAESRYGYNKYIYSEDDKELFEKLKEYGVNLVGMFHSEASRNSINEMSDAESYRFATEDLLNLSQDQLIELQKLLNGSDSNLAKNIDAIIKNNRYIDNNTKSIEALDSSIRRLTAEKFGIKNSAGQTIFDNYLEDQDSEAIKIDKVEDATWKYSKDPNINPETIYGFIQGKLTINSNNQVSLLNQKLRSLADAAGVELTSNIKLSDIKDVTSGEQLAEKENLVTVDGKQMSIGDFVEYAENILYEKEIETQERDVIDALQGEDSYTAINKFLNINPTENIKYIDDETIKDLTTDQADLFRKDLKYDSEKAGKKVTVGEGFATIYQSYFDGKVPEAALTNPLSGQFTLDTWKLISDAYKINEKVTEDALNTHTKNLQDLLTYLSIIANSETSRGKYTTQLGMSEQFGKRYNKDTGTWVDKEGYSGFDVREMAINNRKLELDYTKQIADEMERAFGKNRLELLQKMSAQQEATAKLATQNYLDLVNGVTAADKTKFLDEDGNFNYTKALDYQAQLEADKLQETDAYTDLMKIIDAYDKMNESAWAVTDAKIAEWKYSFEIVEQFKGILDSFRQFQNETKNWSKGIVAYGQESVINTYGYLTQQWNDQYAFTNGNSLKRLQDLQTFEDNSKTLIELYQTYQKYLKPGFITDVSKYEESFGKSLKISLGDSFDEFIEKNDLNNNPFLHVSGKTDKFYFDETSYNEEYQDALDSALNSLEGLKSIVDNLFTAWENGLKELQDLYDNVIKQNQDITKLLQSQINLNKLLNNSFSISENYNKMVAYGEENFDLANSKAQQMLTQYQAALADGNKIMIENTRSSLVAAASEVSEWANSQMELIGNRFKDLVNEALEDMMGASLDVLSLDWSLEMREDERYLDEVNETYARDMMSRRFQAAIDETDSIEAQNKLMEKRAEIEEELAEIKARQGRLSQYDLDRAEALYDVTLKQIALEEAQNTANTMKLTRDAFGNYTYQYVADEDAVSQAYEEVATAQNNLYNLQKEHQKELVNDWQSLWTQYTEDMAAAQKTGDELLIEEVYERYFGENGFLKEVRDSLIALGDELPFSDSLSVQKIINMEFDEEKLTAINSETAEAIGNVNDKLKTANGTLESILTTLQNNKYFGATDINEDGIISSDEYNAYIASQEDNINNALRGIEADMGTYMTEIAKMESIVGSSMTNYLLNTLDRKVTEDNTTAVRDLTDAMYDVIDAFEKDGVEGQITFNDNVVYTRSETGDWAIKENDTNS